MALNVYRGATSVVMRTFDPVRAWELIEQERVTIGLMVPAMMNFMLQVPNFQRFDFSTVRWIMTGAAPVPVALVKQYAEFGIGVQQVYGLTETCGPACLMDSGKRPPQAGLHRQGVFPHLGAGSQRSRRGLRTGRAGRSPDRRPPRHA